MDFLSRYAELIKVLVIVAAAGAYTYGVYSWASTRTAARYETAIAAQKQEAARELQKATDDARAREQALAQTNTELEAQYHGKQFEVDEKDRKLRAAVRASGGLRDPGGRRDSGACTTAQASSTASGNNAAASGARLSAEAEEFLFAFARDANKVVEQLKTAQKEYLALWKFCGG